VVALHVGFSAFVIAGGPFGPAVDAFGIIAASVVAAVQALLLAGLRRWPRTALALYCAAVVPQTAFGLPQTGVGWVAAAYVMARHGVPRTALVLVVTTVATAGLLAPTISGGPVVMLAFWLIETVVIGAQMAAAGGVGAVLRAQERRAQRWAEEQARRRHEAALAGERQRITDELHGVVVVALHRLVATTTGLADRLGEDADRVLAQVQDRAREALAAMRRTLVVLRTEPPAADPPTAVPRGWTLPRPTRSGWVLVGVLLATTAVLGLVFGLVPEDPEEPLVAAVVTTTTPWRAGPYAVLFLAVQAAAAAWWRSAPVVAFAGSTIGSAGAALHGGSSVVLDLAWILPAWQMMVAVGPLRSALALVAAEALLLPAAIGLGPWPTPPFNRTVDPVLIVVGGVVPVAVVWAAAWSWRVRSQRRTAARVRAEDHRTRQLVAEERHRIARELHDVVAHLVSAVAVQAGAARAVVGLDPTAARDAVRHVEEQGERIRTVLPELVGLSPVGEIVPLTREGVERLLGPIRAAGVPVTAHVVGEPVASAGETGLFAQRILTEALTNTLRHAGPSPTRVAVEHTPDAITVTVVDAGPADAAPHTDGAGLGLVGMRERVRLLGGHLVAGPTAEGGWSVRARLPLVPGLPPEEEVPGRSAPDRARPRAEVAGPAVP
jgi:signal transduction histidine kinase